MHVLPLPFQYHADEKRRAAFSALQEAFLRHQLEQGGRKLVHTAPGKKKWVPLTGIA